MLIIKIKIKNVFDINWGSFSFRFFIIGVENSQFKIYNKKFLK